MEVKKLSGAASVLSLVVQPETIKRFICFFTEGVTLPITTGGTLMETVCEQLGVDAEYFEARIQTIFLNFKAVDDPQEARVSEGAIIALSAAMPGLVGATMRRGGTYAALRSSISFAETGGNIEHRKGRITLKLLNMVGRELGPVFLANGVYLAGEQLADFLARSNCDLKQGCREAVLDDKTVIWEQLCERDWAGQRVLLKVTPV
ncbi:MAG: hypothetical protein GY697_05440 [Desulfobacterales bacterium]|nr:hypothetical protein [Desulfobacterales bacterium]